tara:strand:- start:486 stop:710 length:225 start_codon:yes stop_codon:yes gene_type:complete
MTQPFLKRHKGKSCITLHKSLYPKRVIEEIRDQEPQTLLSIKTNNNYYFIEFKAKTEEEYLDFLNYLIYCRRDK